MRSLNKVTLIGNVGNAPEINRFQGGAIVAKFSLATSEKYKNKAGEMVESTEWHNVEAWGKAAEIVEKYIQKGNKLYVEGKIKTDSWEKDGERKYSTKIQLNDMLMLSGAPTQRAQAPQAAHQSQPHEATPHMAPLSQEEEDDLPF